MNQRPRAGSSLAGTMVFLVLVMMLWAVVHRQAASCLRVERICRLRQDRTTGAARALAWGLALLETGLPPSSPYQCRANVGAGGTFVITFTAGDENAYTVSVRPVTDDDSDLPAAPETF